MPSSAPRRIPSTFLYGLSAFTHSTNSSSASIATGVRSFQLKGMPVASGVVNRFDSVMMILCGLPAEDLTSRKPSPPAAPALLITTIGCFIRLCLVMMPWMVRAIWSAPPPVPAGMMNSTGRVGSQAALAGIAAPAAKRAVTAPHAICLADSFIAFSPFTIAVPVFAGFAALPHLMPTDMRHFCLGQ